MGNLFRPHVFTYLLFVFTTFLMSACDVPPPIAPAKILPTIQASLANANDSTGQGGEPAQSANDLLTTGIHCSDVRRDECSLRVTLNPVREDVDLSLLVHGDHGIRFLPNLDVLPNAGGDSAIHHIKLLRGESRSVDFPYQPRILSGVQENGEPNLPGAFKVEVVATHADTGDRYADVDDHTFMWLNDFGEFHSLQSLDAYKNKFEDAFITGNLGLRYSVIMEPGARPYRGSVLVRADSIKDDYNPIMEISSTGAVTFLDDRIWAHTVDTPGTTVSVDFPPINNGGSRVARIPFELDRNGRLLDGTYVFLVSLTDENDTASKYHETMPVVIELHSDPQYPNEHWLSTVVTQAAPVTPTPNGGQGAPGPEKFNADNINKDELCEALKNVRFENEVVREVHWTREIAHFDGTLCDAYLEYVAFKIPVSWNEFKISMVLANRNLVNEGENLEAHEVYVFPELDLD